MTEYQIHPELPSGFHFADNLQTEQYKETGSVNGAAKVIYVQGESDDEVNLAVRLRPPHVRMTYAADYRRGWRDGRSLAGNKGDSQGYVDGYRDAAEGRPKWHLAYCTNHGDHEGGCGA